MKKRFLSLLLTLLVLLAALTPAASAAAAKPKAPAWVDADEYIVFEGDPVYEQATWSKILKLRADAAKGNPAPKEGSSLYAVWKSGENYATGTPGLRYELALIGMKYGQNAENGRDTTQARKYFSYVMGMVLDECGSYNDPVYQLLELWYLRAALLASPDSSSSARELKDFLSGGTYTMADFKGYAGMSVLTAEQWARIEGTKSSAEGGYEPRVWVDGYNRMKAVKKNGWAMIPLRQFAEMLGSEISFDSAAQAVRVERAGVEIVLPLGKTTATVNGQSYQLNQAPYKENGVTYFPLHAVEMFGQAVEWVPMHNCYSIRENKALAGESNLEDWALAMGAVLIYINGGNPTEFAGTERYTQYQAPAGYQSRHEKLRARGDMYAYERARYLLSGSWGINSREDLIYTVCSMTVSGHNDDFLSDVQWINSMKSSEYQKILRNSTGMDKYMFPYTKQLGKKWGEQGILCWDLFRMSDLVQWGYMAGYITYPEALALLEPAAKRLQENFKNWDQAYNNYLDGYYWWAREDVLNKDPWASGRGLITSGMLELYGPRLLDDDLFKTPIQGVPGVTAESLLLSVLAEKPAA